MNCPFKGQPFICCDGTLTTQEVQWQKSKKIPPPKLMGVAVFKKCYFLGGVAAGGAAAAGFAAAGGAAAGGFAAGGAAAAGGFAAGDGAAGGGA